MLSDHVLRFRHLRPLVIGDAMLDTYLEGMANRLCSEGPVPVVQKTNEEHAPGGAANTAANLRAMGAGVDFISIIGADASGTTLRSCLAGFGVSDDSLVTDPCGSTIHKLRIIAGGQYVARFDEGEPRSWSPEAESNILHALNRHLRRAT